MADHPGFPRPIHATRHCRHYSYVTPITARDSGPHCAKGVDLSEPGASKVCMPDLGANLCPVREDYTDEERAVWVAAREEGVARLGAAVQAVPHPLPLRTSGDVECPSCGGRLSYSRWHRGAQIVCATTGCCSASFNIKAGADWPASPKEG